jgi:hypothetical protein
MWSNLVRHLGFIFVMCKLLCWQAAGLASCCAGKLLGWQAAGLGICYSGKLLGFLAGTGNTKGGTITVPLTSCLTGLELAI